MNVEKELENLTKLVLIFDKAEEISRNDNGAIRPRGLLRLEC